MANNQKDKAHENAEGNRMRRMPYEKPVLTKFGDVTTIMRLLGELDRNVRRIRNLMEEELGEEEEDSEDDA